MSAPHACQGFPAYGESFAVEASASFLEELLKHDESLAVAVTNRQPESVSGKAELP